MDNALVAMSRFIADSREGVLHQGAEFLRAKEAGLVGDEHVVGEIGQVLAGDIAGRRSAEEITVYKSLGHVVQDLASAWALSALSGERPRARQVLHDMAEGFVDGDLFCGAPPRDVACQDLPDFADDMLVADQARFFGSEKFSPLAENAFAAVGDERDMATSALSTSTGACETGADHVQVRARPHPAPSRMGSDEP